MRILKYFLFFIICAVLVNFPILALWFDIGINPSTIDEISMTEISEAILLIASSFILFKLSKQEGNKAYFLMAGVFITLLIRELDFYFDLISHGAWVYPAWFVAIIFLVIAVKNYKNTINGLENYLNFPSFGMMFAGLLTLLIYSRVFGMGDLWKMVLEDGYIRIVKDAGEETTELFGYILCFISLVWHTLEVKKSRLLN